MARCWSPPLSMPAPGSPLCGNAAPKSCFCPGPDGQVDLPALLNELARRGINEVHAEAGFGLSGSLLRAGLVDELLLYLAPCLIGDAARGMFDLPALESLAAKAHAGDSRRPFAGSARPAPARPLQLSPAHTGHSGSRPNLMLRHSIDRPSSSQRRPSTTSPHPAISLRASAACIVPMMPVSGANTPITAQRSSSTASASGNRQW
jgi:hypothetical protein